MAAIFTAWNTLRFQHIAALLRMSPGLVAKCEISLSLGRSLASHGRGAPSKFFDDIINRAELDVTRAHFFSRWRVFAGKANDRPVLTPPRKCKHGKKKKGKR